MKLEEVKKIAVIGAGTMGHGIAQIFAQAGYEVNMMARTQKRPRSKEKNGGKVEN